MTNLEKWCDERKLYRFEGESGTKNLETVLKEIGYKEDGFRYGSAVERFLQDNPGAVEVLLNFISEHFDEKFAVEEEEEELQQRPDCRPY
jgi:hypothetical protein